MNRIEIKIKNKKKNDEKFLVAYLTGGVPDISKSIEYFNALEKGGADIIEIGVPFSDALADGPVNQAAALNAINNGIGIEDMFIMVNEIRKTSEVPIIFLVYYNTVFHFGPGKFATECQKNGVDGIVIPDLPMEERGEILEYTNKAGLCLIPLVAPTSKKRIADITADMKGFTYCVSSMGVTGERKNFSDEISGYIDDVKSFGVLPVAVGFGISDSETAEFFYNKADGVIVGSAIVKRIMDGKSPAEITNFVKTLVKQ